MPLFNPLTGTVEQSQPFSLRDSVRELEADTPEAQAGPEFESSIPQFSDNPLGAVGLVLSETARGLQGQQSEIPRLRAQDMQREQQEIQKLMLGQQVMEQFVETIDNISADDTEGRQTTIETFNERFGQTFGIDFSEVATRDPVEMRERLSSMSNIDPKLFVGMSPAQIDEALGNPNMLNAWQQVSDKTNLQPAVGKLRAAAQTPEGQQALARLRSGGGITMSEIEQLADTIGLSGAEVSALRSNQDTVFPELSNEFGVRFVSQAALQEEEAQRIAARFRPAPRATDRERYARSLVGLPGIENQGLAEAIAAGDVAMPPEAIEALGGQVSESTSRLFSGVPFEDLDAWQAEAETYFALGDDRETSILKATGGQDLVYDETRGLAYVRDTAGNNITFVPIEIARDTEAAPERSIIPEDISRDDIEASVGAAGAVNDFINWGVDVFSGESAFPDVQETISAIDALRAAEQSFGMAVIPGRDSNQQMDVITRTLPTAASLSSGGAESIERAKQRAIFWDNHVADVTARLGGIHNVSDIQALERELSQARGFANAYRLLEQAWRQGGPSEGTGPASRQSVDGQSAVEEPTEETAPLEGMDQEVWDGLSESEREDLRFIWPDLSEEQRGAFGSTGEVSSDTTGETQPTASASVTVTPQGTMSGDIGPAIEAWRQNPDGRVTVTVHSGDPSSRASSVISALIQAGVPRDRIDVLAGGGGGDRVDVKVGR